MECVGLKSLIESIEYGTNLHISVVFLEGYGNEKTRLDQNHTIHKTPVCDAAKSSENGFLRCFSCRNRALDKAVSERRAFAGLCVNGVYEYCHPVVFCGNVVCVIFVGNIVFDENCARLYSKFDKSLIKTMQRGYSYQDAERAALIIESYIVFLLEKYPKPDKRVFNPLTENIKNYIEENILYPFSMAELVSSFHYNEKYLGRMFKKEEGISVKEYANKKKLERAAMLLKETKFPVTEISCSCGFNNVTYFNRMFKKKFGMSPKEYRSLC